MADAFPDWYPILRSSRISCPPQTQSSENNDNTVRSNTGSVTGLTGDSASSRQIPSMRPLSLGQQIDSASRDTTNLIDLVDSQMPTQRSPQMQTQQSDESPERMEDDGERSPSLLDIINAEVPMARPPESNSKPRSRSRVEVRHVGRRQLLSRGPTQHLHADAREQTLKAVPALDHSYVMRVLERPPVLTRLWVLQTLKCRTQWTRTSLNVGTLPVVRIQKHQTPAHPANLNRTFRENVQISLPHAQLSYIDLTVKH